MGMSGDFETAIASARPMCGSAAPSSAARLDPRAASRRDADPQGRIWRMSRVVTAMQPAVGKRSRTWRGERRSRCRAPCIAGALVVVERFDRRCHKAVRHAASVVSWRQSDRGCAPGGCSCGLPTVAPALSRRDRQAHGRRVIVRGGVRSRPVEARRRSGQVPRGVRTIALALSGGMPRGRARREYGQIPPHVQQATAVARGIEGAHPNDASEPVCSR